jgi:hypothetical protein
MFRGLGQRVSSTFPLSCGASWSLREPCWRLLQVPLADGLTSLSCLPTRGGVWRVHRQLPLTHPTALTSSFHDAQPLIPGARVHLESGSVRRPGLAGPQTPQEQTCLNQSGTLYGTRRQNCVYRLFRRKCEHCGSRRAGYGWSDWARPRT